MNRIPYIQMLACCVRGQRYLCLQYQLQFITASSVITIHVCDMWYAKAGKKINLVGRFREMLTCSWMKNSPNDIPEGDRSPNLEPSDKPHCFKRHRLYPLKAIASFTFPFLFVVRPGMAQAFAWQRAKLPCGGGGGGDGKQKLWWSWWVTARSATKTLALLLKKIWKIWAFL